MSARGKGVRTNVLNRFFGQKAKEEPKTVPEPDVAQVSEGGTPMPEQGFNPFKKSLSRTRQFFARFSEPGITTPTSPGTPVEPEKKTPITDDLWDELEEALLLADVGPGTSGWLVKRLRQRVDEEQMRTTQQVQKALQEEMAALLGKASPLRFAKQSPLTVILVIGVNGSGKTTSIGKMAHRLVDEGHKVILAAADTFRAAAIDQLKVWGERAGVPVISQGPGSDPGAVVYDAIQAASTRNYDVLIVDTAGRLHTKYNLMEELKKINKVIQKLLPEGPQELLVIIDATTGQNALLQARKFAEDIGLTGVIITKLDSTAKGGFAFAVADDLGVPIKFVGTGEKIEDLAPFDPQSFVAALFAQD
jgi:fused signal recognition particle receptor